MPRMPLSGVRISCDTMARKRDLARLAASAASRASASARSASMRSVTSRPTLCTSARSACSAQTTTSRQASQRGPSAVVICWSCSARAVRQHADRALLRSTAARRSLPSSASRGCAGQRAIGVVGVGDAAVAVAADDQVALRFEQARGARLGLLQFPGAVGQFLAARLARLRSSRRSRLLRDSTISMMPQTIAEQAADADRKQRRIVDLFVDVIEMREQHRRRRQRADAR